MLFTPGEWHASTSLHSDGSTRVYVWQPLDNDAIPIGDFTDLFGIRTIDECKANAAVSAAAPDLLTALEDALAAKPGWQDRARTAIDKARWSEPQNKAKKSPPPSGV